MILQIIGMLVLGVFGVLLVFGGAALLMCCWTFGASKSDYVTAALQFIIGLVLFYFACALSPLSLIVVQS